MSPLERIAQNLNISPKAPDGTRLKSRELAEKVVNTLASIHGSTSDFSVRISSPSIFDLSAAITADKQVRLPPMYFISRDQVPFKGPNDPYLEDDLLLQDFADTLSKQTFGVPARQVSFADRMYLRMYLDIMQDEPKATEALKFILLHEMGHSEKGHRLQKQAYEKELSEFPLINTLTLGLFKKIALDSQSRKHEAEADAFGLPAVQGGIHLFKTIQDFKPNGLIENIAYAIFALSTLPSHGTYATREENLTKHVFPSKSGIHNES